MRQEIAAWQQLKPVAKYGCEFSNSPIMVGVIMTRTVLT
jgi:hypothetical protein